MITAEVNKSRKLSNTDAPRKALEVAQVCRKQRKIQDEIDKTEDARTHHHGPLVACFVDRCPKILTRVIQKQIDTLEETQTNQNRHQKSLSMHEAGELIRGD